MSPNDDFLSDDYVADLLSNEAKDASAKYSVLGVDAYTASPRPANKMKPNTRFLQTIISQTTSHNAALRAKETAESQAKLQGLSDAEESRRRKYKPEATDIRKRQLGNIFSILNGKPAAKRPAEKLSEDAKASDWTRDRQSSSRDEHKSSRDEREHPHKRRRTEEDEGGARDFDRERSHKRRDRYRQEDDQGDTKDSDRVRSHRRRHRHRQEDDEDDAKDSDRERSHKRRHRHRHSCDTSEDDRRHRHGRRRLRSHSPKESKRRHREISGGSRSRSPQESKRRQRHRLPSDEEKSHPKDNDRHRRDGDSQSRSDRKERKDTAPTELFETKKRHELSDSDSDSFGPSLPPPRSPVRRRGRGATATQSGIDRRFSANYDPKADLDLAPAEDDHKGGDWDDAVESYRDRARWKQQGADRLREAGISEPDIKKWEVGDEKRPEDVRWSKKGEKREWDIGKVVAPDGTVSVGATWGEEDEKDE